MTMIRDPTPHHRVLHVGPLVLRALPPAENPGSGFCEEHAFLLPTTTTSGVFPSHLRAAFRGYLRRSSNSRPRPDLRHALPSFRHAAAAPAFDPTTAIGNFASPRPRPCPPPICYSLIL